MKKSLSGIFIVGLAIIGLVGCNKKTDLNSPYNTDFSSTSFLKVIDGTVGAQRNYVYQEYGVFPISGSLMSVGGAFPTVGTPTYASVFSGNRTLIIKDTLSTSTQKALTFTGTLNPNTFYSLFTYDTITSPKYVLVQDNIEIPTDTTSRIRFANLIYSSSAIPNVDVYSKLTGTNLFTNVSVGQVSNFIPFLSRQSDSIFVRATGTTANLVGIAFNPTAQRSYTLAFIGRYQTPSGTLSATSPARSLIVYTNR